jgi:prepilin-type N-terminal cleavage/methylation domain-containing protein
MHKSHKTNNHGFTLVEIIVSLAIFSVVSVVAVGALLKIVDANKKAQSIQSAMTNLNYALESMSRELRVSNVFYCDDSVSNTGTWGNYSGTGLENQSCVIGQGKAIIFKTSAPAIDSSNNKCSYNLIAGYRFINDSGVIRMQKANQPRPSTCAGGSALGDTEYRDIISVSNVNITGFNLGVLYDSSTRPDLTRQYPLALIRIAGYAGVRERDKTYFDVETAISARVSEVL